MMSCTGSDGPKDDTGLSQDATFDHAVGVADSLYNCMQFRDAYKLYLQLLDTKEAEADSEKKLRVLDALCNSSELSGNKRRRDPDLLGTTEGNIFVFFFEIILHCD